MHCSKFVIRTLLPGLLAMSMPLHAAQWREVGKVPDTGTTVYVDDGSLNVDHDTIVKGWVRFAYDKPHERDGYKLDAYVSQRMVNCEANRYWLLDGWGYRNNAEPVRFYGTGQEWQTPAPGSENEIASAVLCYETKSTFSIIWEKLAIPQRLNSVWHAVTGE